VGGDGDLGAGDGRFEEVYGTGAEGAVLVRPDGFVAWRAAGAGDDPERVLGDVLGRILARSTPAAEPERATTAADLV
jgi:putative polyketide hydroxylase